jgi:hypothetical protein
MDKTSVGDPADLDEQIEADPQKFYAIAHAEKRRLLAETAKHNVTLKKCSAIIISQGEAGDQKDFPVLPKTPEEAYQLGEAGAIRIRQKKEYESLTYNSLVKLQTLLYKTLFPTATAEEQEKGGIGAAEWIWANRDFKLVTYVERVFFSPEKRRNPETEPKTKPCKKLKPSAYDIPKTKEDFLKLPMFQDMAE